MDDDSSMSMTFGSFSDYKLSFIFSSWAIKSRFQFAIAWLGVFLSVIAYHGIRYLITLVEIEVKTISHRQNPELESLTGSKPLQSKKSLWYYKVVHAFLTSINYTVSVLDFDFLKTN
jgi:hypothetical protein